MLGQTSILLTIFLIGLVASNERSHRRAGDDLYHFLTVLLFIFLGAPHIEVLRGNKSLTGALTWITVSVVGIVLNLALVFGAAVIWPQGLQGGTNWFAALMSVVALVALYRFKVDVLWVVLAGGLIGLCSPLFFT